MYGVSALQVPAQVMVPELVPHALVTEQEALYIALLGVVTGGVTGGVPVQEILSQPIVPVVVVVVWPQAFGRDVREQVVP